MSDNSWCFANTYKFMERTRRGLPRAMICVARNGWIQGRESHAALPESPDEIADSVLAAAKLAHRWCMCTRAVRGIAHAERSASKSGLQ
jgi:hypothetical protein